MTDETTSAPGVSLQLEDGDWGQVWDRALGVLEETVTQQQRAFIRLSRLDGVVGETALVSVPHQFAKDVIEARLRQVITSVLSEQLGAELRIAVVVDPSLDLGGPTEAVPAAPTQPAAPPAGAAWLRRLAESTRLPSRFTWCAAAAASAGA